jgi:hypothetical protein
MMTHDEMIAVLTHHKNGGEVQCRSHHSNTWHDFHDGVEPSWHFSTCDFRAKPLVVWIITDSCNKVTYADKHKPLSTDISVKIRKFVEVME